MTTTMIRLRCKECGKIEDRPELNTFNGHLYEQGVTYVCECRGDMEEIDFASIPTKIADKLIDGVFEFPDPNEK